MKAPRVQLGVSVDERAILDRLATGVLVDQDRARRLCDCVLEEIRAGRRPEPLDFGSLAATILEAARLEADLVEVFREHRDQLISLADQIVQDRERAEDLVHEVFVRFLGAPSKLSSVRSLRRWVIVSVKNRCRDWLRRVRRAPATDPLDEERVTAADRIAGPAASDGWVDRHDWIEARIRRLDVTPSERDAALIALQHIAENAALIVEAIECEEIRDGSGIERFIECSGVDGPWSPATFRRYLRSIRSRLRQQGSELLSDSGLATKG